jgi:hypothetical protein
MPTGRVTTKWGSSATATPGSERLKVIGGLAHFVAVAPGLMPLVEARRMDAQQDEWHFLAVWT